MSSTLLLPDSAHQTSTSPTAPHLRYLDGVRALAAIYVVMHHSMLQSGIGTNLWLTRQLVTGLSFGHFAVDVFIVLSGFCLMLPVVRSNGSLQGGAWRFYRKRARRILPPYYLSLLLSGLLIALFIGQKTGTPWDDRLPVTAKSVWTHLFLVHNLFYDTNSRINGVLWSVATEWQIYFLFPLLLWIYRRWGIAWTNLLALGTGYAGLLLLHFIPLNRSTTGVCPHFLGQFALGMLGATIAFSTQPLHQRVRERMSSLPLTIILTATSIVILWKQNAWHINQFWYGLDLLVGVCTCMVLVTAASPRTNGLTSLLSWRPLVFLGTFSYSIYLIHTPILQLLTIWVVTPLHWGPNVRLAFYCLAGMPICVGIAYLFFLCCERPFLTRSRQKTV